MPGKTSRAGSPTASWCRTRALLVGDRGGHALAELSVVADAVTTPYRRSSGAGSRGRPRHRDRGGRRLEATRPRSPPRWARTCRDRRGRRRLTAIAAHGPASRSTRRPPTSRRCAKRSAPSPPARVRRAQWKISSAPATPAARKRRGACSRTRPPSWWWASPSPRSSCASATRWRSTPRSRGPGLPAGAVSGGAGPGDGGEGHPEALHRVAPTRRRAGSPGPRGRPPKSPGARFSPRSHGAAAPRLEEYRAMLKSHTLVPDVAFQAIQYELRPARDPAGTPVAGSTTRGSASTTRAAEQLHHGGAQGDHPRLPPGEHGSERRLRRVSRRWATRRSAPAAIRRSTPSTTPAIRRNTSSTCGCSTT